MVTVGSALTEGVVCGVVAALAAGVLYLLLSRTRRMSASADDAVMAALARMSKAAPDLRCGLTERAADNATPHLRKLFRCVAVGITDRAGTLLSWDGAAAEHYEDLTTAISRALAGHRREHVEHHKLSCQAKAECPMREAVVVPLIADGVTEGTVLLVADGAHTPLLRMADTIAGFIATQLELAKLDDSRQELAKAEVRALRAQISPHFVYNALNTISSQIRTDPERARELLGEFAEFTRYSFRTDGFFTTLADELRNVDRYLTLERARFGPRLEVRLKMAPEVMSVNMPFLVLQPLVENAVRHGLSRKPGGGTVTVVAKDDGNDALITVEDDGVGMDADRLTDELSDAHRSGAHVGIGNINQRMRSHYGDRFALAVETAPGEGMKVILRVPKFSGALRPVLPDFATALQDSADKEPEPEVTNRFERSSTATVARPARRAPFGSG
jgi:two-component system LytT family sensor kinase